MYHTTRTSCHVPDHSILQIHSFSDTCVYNYFSPRHMVMTKRRSNDQWRHKYFTPLPQRHTLKWLLHSLTDCNCPFYLTHAKSKNYRRFQSFTFINTSRYFYDVRIMGRFYFFWLSSGRVLVGVHVKSGRSKHEISARHVILQWHVVMYSATNPAYK